MKKNSIVVLPLIAAAVIAVSCGGAGQSAGFGGGGQKNAGHRHQFGGDCCTIRSTPGSDPIAQEWTAGTQFNPAIDYGTLNDERDGKTYRTVKIGKLTWMAENLNYQTGESRCLENKEDNCQKYGRLYGWDAAKNACPAGWRMPYGNDRSGLWKAGGGSNDPAAKAAALSSAKKDFWEGRGTDDLGFSALPGASLWWCGDDYDDVSMVIGVSFRDEYSFVTLGNAALSNSFFAYLRCVQENPNAAPQAPAESESAPPGAN